MALRFLSPGPHPGEQQSGTAATFDQARSDFEAAWEVFLANRTQADFRAWRDQPKLRPWAASTIGPFMPARLTAACPLGARTRHHRPLHSITLSARARTLVVTTRSSPFAGLRMSASSTIRARSTGTSSGLPWPLPAPPGSARDQTSDAP